MPSHKPLGKAKEPVIFFFLDITVINRHHLMTPLPIISKNSPASDLADRDCHFISIVPRMCGSNNRLYHSFMTTTNTNHHIFDSLFFDRKLSLVGHMGNLAATARSIDWTFRLTPLSRCFFDRNQFSCSI